MNFISLIGIEFKKIRRSKILFILLAASVILWIPSILNSDINFKMQAEGILPEYNFLIQGFLGISWFMFPASIIVSTVLINQTERSNNGILKMLAMPVSTSMLCLAKFIVLSVLAAAQIFMMVVIYYISAAIASNIEDYNFMLPPLFVFKEAGILLISAIPMAALFWLLSVCIKTPVFSIGTGLAAVVPSVLIINTKIWFAYPVSYPFYIITAEYSKLSENMDTAEIQLVPWLPVAVLITVFCLAVSCIYFGHSERK
ncbi:MAG: ABC transporter permease [Lachnospiraceae bacterium]|nr:ABC transporter permease [Lachnospiraceae bacterium]